MATEKKKKKLSGVTTLVKKLLIRKPKQAKPVSQNEKINEKKSAKTDKRVKEAPVKKLPPKTFAANKIEKKIEVEVIVPKVAKLASKRKQSSNSVKVPEIKKVIENETHKHDNKNVAKKTSAKTIGFIKKQVPVSSSRQKAASGKKENGKAKGSVSVLKKNAGEGPRYFFNTDIPEAYNETYLRAIPRDPQWMFVFWELSEQTRNDLRIKMGAEGHASAKRVLRLIDVTDNSYDGNNPQRYIDIEINEFANSWYIQVPESNRNYLIELGLLTKEGRFYFAARSNVVGIPRKGVSSIMDEEWDTVSTDELIRMSSDAMHTPMGASERRFAAVETLVGHAGLVEENELANSSGSGGLSDYSSSSRY